MFGGWVIIQETVIHFTNFYTLTRTSPSKQCGIQDIGLVRPLIWTIITILRFSVQRHLNQRLKSSVVSKEY